MDVSSRMFGDVVVFFVDAGVRIESDEPILYNRLRTHLGAGQRKFIFDFKGICVQDAFDLSRILECAIAIKDSGGILKLSSLAQAQAKNLIIIQYFETYPSAEVALESFLAP